MDDQRETILQNAEHEGDIEMAAKARYAAQTAAWTGAPWDWDKASDEVKEKFRAHARAGTRPPLPHEEDGFTKAIPTD